MLRTQAHDLASESQSLLWHSQQLDARQDTVLCASVKVDDGTYLLGLGVLDVLAHLKCYIHTSY